MRYPISAKKFLEMRDRLGLTQEELATESGLTLANVRRLGGKKPATTVHPKTMRRLAQVMKLPLADAAAALSPDEGAGPALSIGAGSVDNLSPASRRAAERYAGQMGMTVGAWVDRLVAWFDEMHRAPARDASLPGRAAREAAKRMDGK